MAATAPTADDKARAALLATLSRAVWSGISARDAQIAAIKACESTEEMDDVRDVVLRTYMAKRAHPTAAEPTAKMLADAAKVLAKMGANSKEETRNKRTQEQELHYTGARQYLWSLRKSAGIAKDTGPKKPREPRQPAGDDAPAVTGKLTFETGADLRAFAFAQAKMLTLLLEKHNTMVDPALRKAVTTFAKATAGWEAKAE